MKSRRIKPNAGLAHKKKMNCITFYDNKKYTVDSVCTIDLVEIKTGQPCVIIPRCGHIFHPSCIKDWLNSQKTVKRCPNCNSDLSEFSESLEQADSVLFDR